MTVPLRPLLPFESTNLHLKSALDELDMKWKLNAISTGAHIIKGKVFKNLMVDVQVLRIIEEYRHQLKYILIVIHVAHFPCSIIVTTM